MYIFSTPGFPILLVLFLAALILRQWGAFSSKRVLKYLFTPLVTASVAAIAFCSMIDDGITLYRSLILAALVFSLVADVILMVDEVDLLPHGIFYFMLAHGAFIAAFSLDYSFKTWHAAPALGIIVFIVLFNRAVRGRTGGHDHHVLVYSIVIGVMMMTAVAHAGYGYPRKAIFVIAGASLFLVSDLLIAFLTFIRPHPRESVIVWSLYAPAQLILALSCFA
ncbi:MAG: lysoplasmalogenase [Spirochaetes bacterium]|nr:lysoplasmalogenase [Spirochaetota bacterium]